MLNNKSSSVKLDLGPENEEEEEYEEEIEEDEIQEMEGEGDEMDNPLNMEEDLIDMDMDMDIIDNEGVDKVTDLQMNQNRQKYPDTIPTGGSNSRKKNETVKDYQSTKNPREINIRHDQGEKTVFTRLSEELYKKFLSNKESGYKKTSSYDYFVTDKFLNRVVEKNDPTAAVKFGNFLNRNKEYVDRKVARLNERIQNITNEMNSNCTGIPNGKTFSKEELRDPNEFLQDQVKYYQTKLQQIESLRNDVLSSTNSNIRNVPEISKKSKALAEKKSNEENAVAVHDRLFKEKLNKEKKHIIKEKKVEKKKGKKEKTQENKKKTIDEINGLVEKLYKDAQERKMKKTQLLEDQNKLREFFNIYNSEDELSTFNSKVLILEKFVQSYERALHNMFNKRESIEINFEEYCKLMKILGFTLNDHNEKISNELIPLENQEIPYKVSDNEESKKISSDSQLNEDMKRETNNIQQSPLPLNKDNNFNSTRRTNKTEKEKEKSNEQKEFSLLKDSWKILSNGQEETGKINSNQLLVFCASILGIYKGESNSTSEADSKLKVPKSPVAEDNTNNELKDLAIKSGTNFFKKNPKLNGTKESLTGKKTKIPHRFSNYKEHAQYNSIHGIGAANQKNKAKSLNTSDKQLEKNPLKTVVPELDISKYFYLSSTVKLIKELFINMYLNRAEFVTKERKRMKEAPKSEHENHHGTLNSRSSDKIRRSVENFKRRVYEEYENTLRNQNNSQSPNQSVSNNTSSIKKKYKMEDIYRILKLKKENEIAKYKDEQKQLEMKECTFQPNKDIKKINSKDVQETIKNLYADGVNKLKSKKTSELKEPEKLSDECTFRPEIHEINSSLFVVNPLIHDERIKKEIEKLEKARIDKRLVEYKKQKGINVIKDLSSVDLKNEELPQWRFEIEKKTSKDPIEIAVNERGNSVGKNKTISRRDFDKTIKLNSNMRTARDPLFNVEVNIDDNYRTERLEIYPDDDPAKLAESFSRKYGLSDEKREKLQLIIHEKLHEHLI